MKLNLGKFKLFPKLDRLEVYLLAADDPIGKKQLRPIFRRKRSGEVLTREQVTAIKKGRRVLRREMKEQGLKRRIDFEVTATNLGLYFDRNRLFWPFFLWLIRSNTVAKVLATVAVLATVVTVTEPVIEYVIQYITQYVDKIVTEYVDKIVEKDRFTISLSDEMLNKGFELSETPGFEDPKEVLVCIPSWDVPCVSISQIPADVDMTDGTHHDTYFAYTFYCRYINKEAEQDMTGDLSQYAIDYDWGIRIAQEGLDSSGEESSEIMLADETEDSGQKVSDAVWVMVIQDGEVIVCAKKAGIDENGNLIPEMLPSQEVLERDRVAFVDRSIDYINAGLAKIAPGLTADTVSTMDEYRTQVDAYFDREGISDLTRLMLRTENWRDHYKIVGQRGDYNYYQVVPENFVSDNTIVERTRTGVLPYVEGSPNMHKYTVVIWLEGDDPECTNELMNGHIGLNFQIKGQDEDFMDEIIVSTDPTETTEE